MMNAVSKKVRRIITVCIVLLADVAIAAERTYPGAGGDLASTEVWGPEFPGVHDSVLLNNDGLYTASSDLSIEAMFVDADDATLDFTATPVRKISLNGDTGTSGAAAVFAARGQGKKLALKGGTWYSSTGKGNFRAMAHTAQVRTKPCSLTISDGCVITNINRGLFLALIDDSTAHLTGGSVVYSTGTFVGADGSTFRNSITVDGGSRVYTGSHFYPFNSSSAQCTYLLSGMNTRQTCVGVVYWEKTTNCTFTIRDGAKAEFAGFRVGVGGQGNLFVVDGAATSFTATSINVGGDGTTGGGSGNVAILSSASTDNDYGNVSIGYGADASDNMLILSNTTITVTVKSRTWTLGGAKTGYTGGRGNTLVFKGDSHIVSSLNTLNLHAGSEVVIEVPSGGFDSAPLQFQKYAYSSSDVVFKLNCRAYRRTHPQGGRVVLATAGASTWLDTTPNCENLKAAIAAMNANSEKTGCTYSIDSKQLVCDIAPPKGLLLMVR